MGKSASAWCCNADPIRVFVLVFVTDPLSELCHLLLIMGQETQKQESALVSKARQSVIWNHAQMYK